MSPSRRRKVRRRLRPTITAVTALVLVAAGAVTWVVVHATSRPVTSLCTAGDGSGATYSLAPDQAQNAAIISAVASRLGMPDHAVTVALAAALQESKLRNLPYGDRDSLGLFQQRPSQGWGTPAQIMDPAQSTAAFLTHLAAVPGWQNMAVSDAAQAVQHSASADAYAGWANEARVMGIALTGEVAAGFACHLAGYSGAAPVPGALSVAATDEFGTPSIGVPLSQKQGWRVASWAVAHAYAYHVTVVSFGGERWRTSSSGWVGAGAHASSPGPVSVTPP